MEDGNTDDTEWMRKDTERNYRVVEVCGGDWEARRHRAAYSFVTSWK
jgi:hypothetical protein